MNFDFSYKFPRSIEEIDTFTGKEFELFLFQFFKLEGYKPTLTDDSGDRGVDIIIQIKTNDTINNVGIQAKRWKANVTHREISDMLAGKSYYKVDELWIVTTSALTSQAQNTALNNDIQILTRDSIIDMLITINRNPNAKFREQINIPFNIPAPITPASNIIKDTLVKKEVTAEISNKDLYQIIVDYRTKKANELNLYPAYVVFNNETITEITENLPLNIEELKNIKGLGQKRIETYGEDIIKIVIDYCKAKFEKEITELIQIRDKITTYNKIENKYITFNDCVLTRIAINKPKSIEELESIDDFSKSNIALFGKYLISQIKNL